MDEGQEFHLRELAKHCRICGRRLYKAKSKATVYTCSERISDLKSAFRVDVSTDTPTVHPQHFCMSCYAAIGRIKAADSEGVPFAVSTAPMEWTEHTHNCHVSTCT